MVNNRTKQLRELRVTVLQDNMAGIHAGLLCQHGMSLFLEVKGEDKKYNNFLFDTGPSAIPVLKNMSILGKNQHDLNLIFLSHCHFDHTGGLVGILEKINKSRIPIVAHPDIFRINISDKGLFCSVGMGPNCTLEAIKKAGGEMVLADQPLVLMPGVLTSGEIKERVEFERSHITHLKTIRNGTIVPDHMADDVSMIFVRSEGLVIITGCAHAGIINILKKVSAEFPGKAIQAVLGGFHLVDRDENLLEKTVADFKEMKVQKAGPTHCSGETAKKIFKREYGTDFISLSVGDIIKLE